MNVLTRAEACKELKCSRSKLYRLEKSRQLDGTYYDVGPRRYYYASALENWKRNGGEHKNIIKP